MVIDMALPPIPTDQLPPPADPFDVGPPPAPEPLLVPPETSGPIVDRETPEPDAKRKALVDALTDMVKQAKNHWEKTFKKMERDQKFASGIQWDEDPKISIYGDTVENDLYVANITLQHIQKRVASTYAKNPQARCRRRPRVLSTVWDGSMESLAQAQAVTQQAQQAMMLATMGAAQMMGLGSLAPGMAPTTTGPGAGAGAGGLDGMPPPGSANGGSMAGAPGGAPAGAPGDAGGSPGAPGAEGGPGAAQPTPPMPQMPPPDEIMNAQGVIQDAQMVKQQLTILNKISRTLEILYEYEVSEQQQPFKSMMKMTVRRAATSGVGWVRLGFQRVMGRSPDLDSRITDIETQLKLIERVSADIADDEVSLDDP